MSKLSYRKNYELLTNKKLPANFHVHHIDEIHENNEFENLVALPKTLHQKLHGIYGIKTSGNQIEGALTLTSFCRGGRNFSMHLFKQLEEAYCIVEKCNQWMDYKDFLMGEFPHNVHNLEYEVKM